MNKLLCFLCLLLLSANLHASSSSSSSSSGYVGPFLNFIDAGAENDQWNVSALVVAPTSVPNSDLSLNIWGSENAVLPQLIDTINGQQFWRYRLSFPRYNISAKVTYQIGSGTPFTVDIPARKTDPHVFFGTCNEYANPTSIWGKINQNHAEKPFHLGILDGDQIYLDMGWGDHGAGVFSLNSVKQIMMAADTETRMAPLSYDNARHIENDLTSALLQHYTEHYSKPGFKEFLATIPNKSLSGDHEYFNGKGSYDELPPVMAKIGQVGERFYMLFQHHTTKTRASETGLIGVIRGDSLLSYNYLLQFETMAFYGLDTRTERTMNQISSPASLSFMFDKLNAVNKMNLFFVTEIPLVYQSLNPVTQALQYFNKHKCLKSLYQKIEKDPFEQRNADLSTDGVDEWSYATHVNERNQIIQRFVAEFVKSKGQRVTFLGGDVHSAGAGEVIDSLTGKTQIFQLTSSALTSPPVPGFIVGLKRVISWFQKKEQFGAGLVDKITGYKKVSDGKESREIALNNWLELESVAGQIYPCLWVLPSETASLEKWLPNGWPNHLDDKPLADRI